MRLIFRPLPLPNEGLNGYLLRLAEGNGYGGISFLCGEKGISSHVLMRWLGLKDASPLRHLIPQLASPRTTFIKPWNHRSSRYCPECLKKTPVWRLEWESMYVTACPLHGCQLVDTCNVCGEQLTWKRKKLMTCDCGAPLKMEPVEAVKSEIALAKAIQEKIYGERCSLGPVRYLSYGQLCHLVHVLGVYSNSEAGRASQKVANLTSLGVAQKLTKAAAEILVNWPMAFYRMLDDLMSLRSSQSESLAKQYGYFYSYAFTRMKASEFRFVREAFEKHIVNNWTRPLNRRNRRVSAQGRSNGAWVPLDFAVQQLGTTHHQLKLLFDAGYVNATVRLLESGRRSVFLDRNELPSIKDLLDDMVDQQTACSMLNIKKSRMLQLLKGRHIGIYLSPAQGVGKWGVSRQSLQELLAIGEGLPSSDSISAASIRMDQILQFWLQHEFLFPTLIQAVKDQKVLPIAVSSEPGIQGWVFDEDRLKQWRNEQILLVRNGALTIPQVAETLKVKQEAVYHFVKIGVLKTSKMDLPHRGVLITQEELQRFRENYALSWELAELIGTSASQAARMLNRHRVQAVCGKGIDGCRQYLYQRAMATD